MRRLSSFHAIEESLRDIIARDIVARGAVSGGERGHVLVSGKGPRIKTILELAAKAGARVDQGDARELDRMAPDNRGVVLELEGEEAAGGASLDEFLLAVKDKKQALVLVLDHVEDVQNFGALLRSAWVFACDLVIAPKRRAAPLSEATLRASAGAAAHVPLALVPNLAEALRRLADAGFWTYAADMGGESLPEAELPAKCAIVLGNEGSGVSRLLKDACDASLSIPQWGKLDSLNVSAAGAIFLYEYRRSHKPEGKA